VLEDGGRVIAESGAEVEYLVDTYGKGKFKPAQGSADYWRYIELIHYAEGSAMLPLLMALYTGMLGDAGAMLKPRVDSEIANNLSYLEGLLGGKEFFVGDALTGADIQLLFVLEAAGARLEPYPGLVKYRAAMQARPAYRHGIEKGGEYALMSR
jgi:glutathione S-transferase